MRLKPDINIKSIYDINVFNLKACEIEAVFFDLDSTVMRSKSGVFEKETLEFLNMLRNHFKIAIISNNKNAQYIKKAQSQVNFPVVGLAKKPDIKVLLNTCKEMNINPCHCAFVGDRPLTDILCAKRAGMLSVLVDSISADSEKKIVRFVRFLERLSVKK